MGLAQSVGVLEELLSSRINTNKVVEYSHLGRILDYFMRIPGFPGETSNPPKLGVNKFTHIDIFMINSNTKAGDHMTGNYLLPFEFTCFALK